MQNVTFELGKSCSSEGYIYALACRTPEKFIPKQDMDPDLCDKGAVLCR